MQPLYQINSLWIFSPTLSISFYFSYHVFWRAKFLILRKCNLLILSFVANVICFLKMFHNPNLKIFLPFSFKKLVMLLHQVNQKAFPLLLFCKRICTWLILLLQVFGLGVSWWESFIAIWISSAIQDILFLFISVLETWVFQEICL